MNEQMHQSTCKMHKERRASQMAREKGVLRFLHAFIAAVGTVPLLLDLNPRSVLRTGPSRPARCYLGGFPAYPRTCPSRDL